MHAAACAIVAWAMLAGCAIILEDLKGMPRGWIRFNKRTRTRLNASAMKFQRLIWETARWNGIEVLVMHSRNTSARCWMCRTRLSGGCHLRKCMRCMVCVDRDVNAALNMLLDASGEQSRQPGTAMWFGRPWTKPDSCRT